MNEFLKSFGDKRGDEPAEEVQLDAVEAEAEARVDAIATDPAQELEPAAAEAEAGPEIYTVQSGDSLSAIAQRLYGDASAYVRIFEANRDKISDPNLIHAGQELVIPR